MRSVNIETRPQTLDTINGLIEQAKLMYDISPLTKITLLSYKKNIVCLIEDIKKGSYSVMRIYRPGYYQKDELENKVAWIKEICKNVPSLIVPEPICGMDNSYIQTLHPISNFAPYYCSLSGFLRGKTFDCCESDELPAQFTKFGEITAFLHQQSIIWDTRESNLNWPVWDYDGLLGKNSRFGMLEESSLYFSSASNPSYSLNQLLARTSETIERRLKKFGKTSTRYGIINSGIKLGNLMLCKNKLAITGFDDCGFGWYLYDLAASVDSLTDSKQTAYLINSWLEGYRRQRHISNEEKSEIPTFIMMHRLSQLRRYINHFDYETPKDFGPDFIEKTAEFAENYLSKMS